MTETALNGIIASYLEDPKRQIEENKTHLRHDLKELWGFMELNSLYVFTAAAVYDFSRHDFLGGYNEVRTKTNGSETIFDSVAYADAGGNRVYVFNLELSPLEATSRKDGGLLVVSNVSVGAKEMVEYAAKALREVFPGVVGIWTSDQPSR